MNIKDLGVGQTVRIKEDGEYRPARVDCFTEDLFTGEKLVIVESLGEVKILRPRSIYKAKKSKNQKQ